MTAIAKSKNETGVALTANDVPTMLENVNAKIKALKVEIKEDNKITSSLPGFGNVGDIDTVEKLVEAQSMIDTKEDAYKKAAKKMKVDVKKFPFSIGNHSAKEWGIYIQSRVSYVVNKVQIDILEEAKTKLESHLSEDMRLAKDLGAIQESMQKFF